LVGNPSLLADFSAEACHFLDDKFLHPINGVLFFEAEVEDLQTRSSAPLNRTGDAKQTHGIADRLVGGIVPDSEVRVVQRLLATDTPGGVKTEHAREEVDGERVSLWEERGERNTRSDRQGADIVLRTRRANTTEGIFRGCAEVVQDLIELVNVIPALEDWTASKELGEDTTDGPDVNCCGLRNTAEGMISRCSFVLFVQGRLLYARSWRNST
jgi:hypothetical protein